MLLVCAVSSVCTLSEEEVAAIREQCGAIKAEANAFFSSQDYEAAVEKYTVRQQSCHLYTLPYDVSVYPFGLSFV